MTLASTATLLYPEIAFPEDAGLPELPNLFDGEWVREAYSQHSENSSVEPQRIRIRQFAHSKGRTAIVTYEAEWSPEEYLPSQLFALRIEQNRPLEFIEYPKDHYLPGLREAALPEPALELVNRHLVAVRARRVGVELIRYRPTSRAVLRHKVSRARFYVRVMRLRALPPFLTAHELVGQTDFAVPRLAGCWNGGGVVWMSEIPGKNLRRNIRKGKTPAPELLLKGLASLWNVSPGVSAGHPFNLPGAYERAKRSFRHHVQDNSSAAKALAQAVRSLDPFIKSWHPTSIAHNDFYDDQMLVLPDGRIALVDFEETGPGDPMLDVGNFLAHLRWRASFGRKRKDDASGAYYKEFRNAALERFGWSERELDFRESACIFRICTNTIRHPQPDWSQRLESGLRLVNETLG